MNRLITTLLAVLIVLVSATGLLVWRADERARDDAKRQACIERAQAASIIAVLVPAVVSSSDEATRKNRLSALATLSNRLDDC
jgi:hypothetical protein